MGRTPRALGAAAAVALIALALPSRGAEAPAAAAPRKDGRARAAERGTTYRPGPMTILGSPDGPGILFFLPRAEARLLPLRPDPEAEAGLLAEDKNTAEILK